MIEQSTTKNKWWVPSPTVLVFLGLLLLLFWMLWPILGTTEYKENKNNCLGQLRQIALAMKAYASDHVESQFFPYKPGILPSDGSNKLFAELLVANEYVKDIKLFRCLSDKHPIVGTTGSLTAEGRCSYAVVYSFSQGIKGALKDDGGTDTPILKDTPSNHGTAGFNVFYIDGHGQWMTTVPPFPNPDNPKKVWLNPKGY